MKLHKLSNQNLIQLGIREKTSSLVSLRVAEKGKTTIRNITTEPHRYADIIIEEMLRPERALLWKNLAAQAARKMRELDIWEYDLDISALLETAEGGSIADLAEGCILSLYELPHFPKKEWKLPAITIIGYPENEWKNLKAKLQETLPVLEGVLFTRDMVNYPANYLLPEVFAEILSERAEGLPVDVEIFDREQLIRMHMNALLAVGDSSEFPPVLTVLNYRGNPDCDEITGLIGKGVTVDSGGYCLKSSGSMPGIKGDMAGGAAVAAAILALAENGVKANVSAVIPMCENRISSGSLLPGDVISSYSGKTIEVLNTDAEGRLILADAVSYAVQALGCTRILDIATLTGAVVNLFGFTTAGVLSNNDSFCQTLLDASKISGERYSRIPYYEEHEKMIDSDLADVKNIGGSVCGTITAGLFVRRFAETAPWIHVDIAGTAWVDAPVFDFQTRGGTGAGVTTLYEMCRH